MNRETYTGSDEPGIFSRVSVKITVRTVFDLLHFMFAHLHQGLGDRRQLRRHRVENDAIVEDPLGRGQKCLRRAVPLFLYVLLHRAQVHGTSDVVFVRRELRRVDRSREWINPGHGFHPAESVFKQNA